MHRAHWFVAVLLVGSWVAGDVRAYAQDLATADRAPRFFLASSGSSVLRDARNAPVLRRRVSIDLQRVPVGEALEAISAQAGLRLLYSKDVLPSAARVSLKAEDITVTAALTEVLLDAGLDVVVSPGGQMTLVKRVARDVSAPTGAVVGRVTDGKTGTALAGATVVIERTSWSATTGNDGRYRIAAVAPGTYTVRARYIGYAPGTASVTVSADQEATADFSLDKSAQVLSEVVATGTVVPTEVKALPTPITVITAEDLERQHVRRFEDALRLAVPSATVWEPGDQGGALGVVQLSLRGTSGLVGGASPKIYVDGVETPLNNSPVDPQSIERIEVVRGPQAAAIYGSDAMGGVVQIFTKHGAGARQRPELDIKTALGVIQSDFQGSGALRQEYTAAVQGQSGVASYHVGGSYTHTGDWLPNYESWVPGANAGLRIEQRSLTIDLSARYFEQRATEINNPRLLAAAPGLVDTVPLYDPFQTREEGYAVQIEYRPAAWWRHSVTAGIDRYSNDLVQTRPRLGFPGDTFLAVSSAQYRKLSVTYHTAVTARLAAGLTMNLTAGVDHRRFSDDIAFASTANASGVLAVVPGSEYLQRDRSTNTGLFAQAQVNVREAFFLTGSIRGEWNPEFGDIGVPISPRVGATYAHQFGATTIKVRAAYGEAIRPPAPGAKGGSSSPTFVMRPNPFLRPERQTGPDGGVDLVFGSRGSLGVTRYDQIAKDLIDEVIIVPFGPPAVHQLQNLARVHNDGWEFEGTLHLGSATASAQYAITNSTPEVLGASFSGIDKIGEQMLNTPRHTSAVTLTATPLRRTSIAAALAYTGSWRMVDYLAFYRCLSGVGPCRNTDFSIDPYLADYPSFATVNVSIEHQLSGGVTGYLGIEDLANTGDKARGVTNLYAVPGRITTLGARVKL